MLPSIKHRVHTQSLSSNRKKISSSIFVKSRVKQSSINACIPYIHELKYANNHCTPKSVNLKNKRISKMFTQANQTVQCKKLPSYYFTKQTEHEQSEPTILSDSSARLKNTISFKHRQNKIHSLLRQFQKITRKMQQNQKSPPHEPNNFKSKKFKQCIRQYGDLPQNKIFWNQIATNSFIQALSKVNPFAKKLKPIVMLCLLKVGHIKTFQQNEMIQWQDKPYSNKIAIILWGEVLIKNVNNKMKIYLFSGDSLNQELLFQKDQKKPLSKNKQQIMKTKSTTGMVYLKLRDYQLVYQQLVKAGQKNSILLAQNMMKWSYAKKKNTRNQFSHI